MKTGNLYRILLAVIAAVFIGLQAFAATAGEKIVEATDTLTARQVFVSLSSDFLDLLNPSTRQSMLDYYDNNSSKASYNDMQGESRIDTLTTDYMKVSLTDVSDLQIKVLPAKKKGYVVATVYTIGDSGKGPDSEIRFFSENLDPLPAGKCFKTPQLEDFISIPKGSITNMKEIRTMVPFPTAVYNLFPGSDELKARLTVEDFVAPDDFNILKLFIAPDPVWKWDGGKFKPMNK